jgi:iron complex outermembrane receptor protein
MITKSFFVRSQRAMKQTDKALTVLCLCCATAMAHGADVHTEPSTTQPIDDGHKLHHLEKVSVKASGQTLHEVVQPTKVISESELQQAAGSSLGELLENMPGVSNASFGPGVGRPVIRGMSGNRVKIAVNGSDAADVSAMSSDHAPMAEASNAQQVEVIYGPGTLLFGSGAIGGVVNVADERFHEIPLLDDQGKGITEGQVGFSVSSVNQGSELSAQLNSGFSKNWVLHLDAFQRESENYDSPIGEVQNTSTQSKGLNLGLTHMDNNGRAGLAVSYLDYEYGVPNEENEAASITPNQIRIDALHEKFLFGGVLESVKTQFSINDYEHDEIDEDTVVGYFDKQNVELKSIFSFASAWGFDSKVGVHANLQDLALCHDHNGCEDGVPDFSHLPWDGSKGSSFDTILDDNGNEVEFAHDTPMPETQTLDTAVFALISKDWAQGKQEYAMRLDQRRIEADPVSIRPAGREDSSHYDDKDFLAFTASAGWTWLTPQSKWGLSLAHTERAPQADEIFWNGDHHATFSYQLDNPELEKETAHTLDLTYQFFAGKMQWDAAVYYYDFDGYIYNELQAVKDPYHGNDVYQFVQEDAYLTGFELAWQYQIDQAWAVNVVTDRVTARLKSGTDKDLPRTPPQTLLMGLSWQTGHWLLKSHVKYFAKQDQAAQSESSTDAYHTLNALAAYEFEWDALHMDVNLKMNNLTDELGRNHVSYLKEFSPLPGRNISLDVQASF